jgi:hypothetical protein
VRVGPVAGCRTRAQGFYSDANTFIPLWNGVPDHVLARGPRRLRHGPRFSPMSLHPVQTGGTRAGLGACVQNDLASVLVLAAAGIAAALVLQIGGRAIDRQRDDKDKASKHPQALESRPAPHLIRDTQDRAGRP